MAPAQRRPGREEARRAQILDAAARVFARKGFGGATVSDIARAARLAEGSIYNYFRSKEELLIHIPQRVAQPVLGALAEPGTPGPGTAAEAERLLLRLAGGMVDQVRANAPFLKVFLSALPHLSPAVRARYLRLLPVAGPEVLERFLRRGMRRGVFRRDLNPVIAARALPGMLMFFLMMQEVLLGRRLTSYDYDRIIPEAVRVFLYGAVPRPPRRGGAHTRIEEARSR